MKKGQTDFEQFVSENRGGLFSEYWGFLKENKKWWLLPILISFGFFGSLLVLGGSGAAPFIYTLF